VPGVVTAAITAAEAWSESVVAGPTPLLIFEEPPAPRPDGEWSALSASALRRSAEATAFASCEVLFAAPLFKLSGEEPAQPLNKIPTTPNIINFGIIVNSLTMVAGVPLLEQGAISGRSVR
jgi:hypothetical protein